MNDITRMLELAGIGHSPKKYEITEQPDAEDNVKIETDFEQLVDYVRRVDRDKDLVINEPDAAQSIDALLHWDSQDYDVEPPTVDNIQAAINQVLHTNQIDVGSTVEIDQGPSQGQVGQVVEVSPGGGFVLVQTPQGQEYVPINEVSIKEDMLLPPGSSTIDENAFNTARDQAIAAGHKEFEFNGTTYPVTDVGPDDAERAKSRFDEDPQDEPSLEQISDQELIDLSDTGNWSESVQQEIKRRSFRNLRKPGSESSSIAESDHFDDELEDERFDDEEDQDFFVVLASEHDGVFVGMMSQDDGRWRENVVSGEPPTYWGGAKYMSYLTAQDVMMWLEKDYGKHYEVMGPFREQQEAKQQAKMFKSAPVDSPSAMKKVEAYNPKVYEVLADKCSMVLEFSNTEDVLIPVQHADQVVEFLLNQGYVEGYDFELLDALAEVDLQNGYHSQHSVDGNDYFPSADTGPAAKRLGPGAERYANNPLFTQRK